MGEQRGDDAHPGASRAEPARPAAVQSPDRRLPGPGPRRRVLVVSGIAAILAASLLGLLVAGRSGAIPWIDEKWMTEVIELRGPAGDALALAMNALGGGLIGVVGVPIGVTIALLVSRRPWSALYFLIASAASALVVQLLKQLFGRARPPDMLVASDYGSFPSGHVANAATIAVALAIIVPRVWVWVAGAAYTLLMALSRTYLGVHWLTDTLGGLLVGVGAALVLWAPFAVRLGPEALRPRSG